VEKGVREVDVAVEMDRELLWALLDERADELPTEALCAVVAAADELLDPLALPTLFALGPVVDDVPRCCARCGSGCRRRRACCRRCQRRWAAPGLRGI
jgi:hypothetical protein